MKQRAQIIVFGPEECFQVYGWIDGKMYTWIREQNDSNCTPDDEETWIIEDKHLMKAAFQNRTKKHRKLILNMSLKEYKMLLEKYSLTPIKYAGLNFFNNLLYNEWHEDDEISLSCKELKKLKKQKNLILYEKKGIRYDW